jgi:hypothetical protein
MTYPYLVGILQFHRRPRVSRLDERVDGGDGKREAIVVQHSLTRVFGLMVTLTETAALMPTLAVWQQAGELSGSLLRSAYLTNADTVSCLELAQSICYSSPAFHGLVILF